MDLGEGHRTQHQAPQKRVNLTSLPVTELAKLADSITDPESRQRALDYIEQRVKAERAAHKLRRTRAKRARKVNRRSR